MPCLIVRSTVNNRPKNILSASIATAVVLSGCQIPAAMIAASHGAMPVTRYVPPTHDVPPQVVYRLDNHRYVTLENYSSCTGDGIVYYNDSVRGIRTRVQYGALTYLGKLHIDSNEGFLAFPDAPGPSPYTCGDRGCYMSINYSMDSGKTFERMSGWRLTSPQIEAYKATEKIIVAIKKSFIYCR